MHATSHLLSPDLPADQRWTLLLDFRKAFNSINHHEAMFCEIRLGVPSITAWLESCYACHPLLFFGDDLPRRVQQVDPLGPLGFAVTLHSLIERIKTSIPNLNLNV